MLSIGICGICGKMGRAVLQALQESDYTVGLAFEDETCPYLGQDVSILTTKTNLNVRINTINEEDLRNVDGVIDFSYPKATIRLLGIAIRETKPLVIGTTGFSNDAIKKIEEASKDIPILFSPNMSLGVNLLFKLTEIALNVLNKGYDVEIFEAHHRFKKDAPSGTARKLLEIVKASASELKDAPEIYDRSKNSDTRKDDEIGVMSLRGGDIVGDHTVYFAGIGERIELTHRASSRENLARGAILAIEFLIGKKNGLYNMFDVLGI